MRHKVPVLLEHLLTWEKQHGQTDAFDIAASVSAVIVEESVTARLAGYAVMQMEWRKSQA